MNMKKIILLLLVSVSVAYAQTDGPAALPSQTYYTPTPFSATPSANMQVVVKPTDNLNAVFAAAKPGTIFLLPQTDFDTAVTIVGPKCTATAWCYVRVNAPDNYLPSWSTRLKGPEYYSKPGALPRIVITTSSATVMPGQFVRWFGVEVTRPSGTGVVYNLMNFSGSHDVVIDRMWFAGTVIDETNRGIILNNTYNVTIQNSWFSEFHCRALVGACGDSQAISGGGSTVQDGNFKIVNNYLEAAGENIIFGGSPALFTPSNIVIAYNDFNKPWAWNPHDPTYAPTIGKDGLLHPWIVKNLLELKNASRVLITGNRMTNTWGGFTQIGAGVLLTAKNAGVNGCPICQVTDVTIRYNYISYVGQAFQIGYSQSDPGYWPADEGRISVHDNLVDHIQYPTCYACGSYPIGIGAGYSSTNIPPATLHDVVIDHNTFLNDGWMTYASSPVGTNAQGVLNVAAPPSGTPNISFTNNVADPGQMGAYSSGGGVNNCFSVTPGSLAQVFAACWTGTSLLTGNNWLPSSLPWHGRSPWPAGNGVNASAGANMVLVNTALAGRK
jgi:hypothetical protein